MKIKITYSAEEDAVAQGIAAVIKSYFNQCTVKQTDTDEKYKHIYVSIKNRTRD